MTMRFYVDTNDLNAAISTVIKALPARAALPILEGIYIEAEGDSLLMRCNDLSLQIDTRIPATVESHGSIVVDGKFLAEMSRKLPDSTTCFTVDDEKVNIVSGRANATRQGKSADEYKSMSQTNKEYSVKIRQGVFKNMIRQTIFAAAVEESNPVLTGILFNIIGNEFSMVALDGYRLALRNENVDGDFEEKRAIIPAKSLLEISRTIGDGDEYISIDFSKTHILINIGETTMIVRLIEGEYIKYKQILPENHETRVRINKKELFDSLERVALMARESKENLIRFNFSSGQLALSANSEVGNSDEVLDADIMGKDIEIAFNNKYLFDVLKNLDDDEIYMDFNNSLSPCAIRPLTGKGFYYLVLPVRLM